MEVSDLAKVSVWKCEEHGELELIDYSDPIAYCSRCGKEMKKQGEYTE